jgi:hypothetical protein
MEAVDLIDSIAEALGVREPTRKKWLTRRSVPHRWRLAILKKAEERGYRLHESAFDNYRRLLRKGTKPKGHAYPGPRRKAGANQPAAQGAP